MDLRRAWDWPTVPGMRFVCSVLLCLGVACGARTGLPDFDQGAGGAGGELGGGGLGGGGSPPELCIGEEQPCGSDVGECSLGVATCLADGSFGPCVGDVGPVEELCNDKDDDCDGVIDNGFGIGEACDGPDNDECFDDVRSCAGCSKGPDILETCNGIDDNCNGEVDSDCDVGDCSPTLEVTGSVPSNPGCQDFPIEKGSDGVINYPCDGGPVTATLNATDGTQVFLSGSVTPNGVVSLTGFVEFIAEFDGCFWRVDHFIDGSIPSGTVQYFYQETLLTPQPNACWSPCTENGTVDIHWTKFD